jgi:Response regulator containing CheY-like receiver domain and AraC-type DNA-binding domain
MTPDWDFQFTFFIYSLRSIVALGWGIALLSLSRRSRQNLPLGIIFILIGLVYLRSGFVRFPVLDACDVYNPSSYIVLILIAPLTIFYAYFSLGEKLTLKQRLLHFIPFALVVFLRGTLALSGEHDLPVSYSLSELVARFGSHPLHVSYYLLLMFVFLTQVFCYFSIALKRFLQVWKIYKEHGLSLRPVKMLIMSDFLFLIYPLTCVFFMSYYNNLHFGLAFNIFVPIIITAISVLNIMLVLPLKTNLCFMDNPEQRIAAEYASIVDQEKEEKAEAEKLMFEKIKKLFEEKEIYRIPHLTLQDLAEEISTNRTYLSNCINRHYGYSFRALVCRYRIEAAKRLLLQTDLDIQEIMNKAGFNSRSSFYNAFKENVSEDLSPSEWRLQQRV